MKILLVEDHAPTREQVKSLLNQEKDMSVVASVGTAEEAIESARRLRPDVVIMDIMLPGMNGIEATKSILFERPDTRILALSNHAGTAFLQAVLAAGGSGYVRKHRASEELVLAIRTVVAGKQYIGENTK
jgi:DNA-binding NarL/FixJ family response regulator